MEMLLALGVILVVLSGYALLAHLVLLGALLTTFVLVSGIFGAAWLISHRVPERPTSPGGGSRHKGG
ncbi:MAG TPA: hypothetical protein VE152_14500 [Acidimicrobiales bacterium]|nr:hypothetical protein [Acidimicrobiales bacterium]